MTSKYGDGENLLIAYIEDFKYYDQDEGRYVSHPDPTFEAEWSYCTGNKRVLKCGRGNYVFFHTTLKKYRQHFITAYFIIKDVGPSKEIIPKHNLKGAAKHSENWENHYVIVGDERSRKLREPGLKFNRSLAEKLTFKPPKPIKFNITNIHGRSLSELQCIASATRSIRFLSDEDVDILLEEINRLKL